MRAALFVNLWIVLSCTNEVTIAVIEGGSTGTGGTYAGTGGSWSTAGAVSTGGSFSSTGGGPIDQGGQGTAGDWTLAAGGARTAGAGGLAGPGGESFGGAGGSAEDLAECDNPDNPLRGRGTMPLIDDFKDGDMKPLIEDGRSGSYLFSGDQSPNADHSETIVDEQLVLQGKRYGAGSGWGAAVGLVFEGNFNGCRYYDASKYAGITFKAKGQLSQELRIQIGTAQVLPESMGGTCVNESQCLDKHHASVALGPEYRAYSIRWEELEQSGWGIPADFSPKHVATIEFAFPQVASDGTEVNYDVSIDDLAFILR